MFKQILALGCTEDDLPKPQLDKLPEIAEKTVFTPDLHEVTLDVTIQTDALLLKLGTVADKTLLEKMPAIRYVGILGTGHSKIDSDYCKKKSIAVCNIADYSTNAVAEFAVSMLLAHYRRLHTAHYQALSENYSEDDYSGTELASLKFGIVGYGAIGQRLASLLHDGFGAKVCYWSRTRKPEKENAIPYMPLNELLQTCDVVSIHLEANKQTQQFFDQDRLSNIGNDTVLVTTSPMELFDLDALAETLRLKNISLLFDHADEMSPKDARWFASLPQTTLYPPIGYTTTQASAKKYATFIACMEAFLAGERLHRVV